MSVDIKNIVEEMDNQKTMLTEAEVVIVAKKVNNVINLPGLNEDRELKVFVKIVRWIDKALYQLLPNEYYVMIREAGNGISPAEAEHIERRLTNDLNKHVNLPFIPENLEGKILSVIVGIIVQAMIKGFHLEQKPSLI